MSIPVIDLFSGPGGLGEGFASYGDGQHFRIAVSAEMDPAAHSTLLLRSYYRRLKFAGEDLRTYYDFCNTGQSDPWTDRTLSLWNEAEGEARNLTLGTPEGDAELDRLLDARFKRASDCVLIGGPPCQAYSIAGRVRNRSKEDYSPEADHRHFLYREYLRVLQKVRPAVFVMENVKGILSSRVGGRRIFHDILQDLVDPDKAVTGIPGAQSSCYRIHSLVTPDVKFCRGMSAENIDPNDFIVCAENHGVPQARHRVILLGIREDIQKNPKTLETCDSQLTVSQAIRDLPKLRSRITWASDSPNVWARIVRAHMKGLAKSATRREMLPLANALSSATELVSDHLNHGGLRVQSALSPGKPSYLASKLRDSSLLVVLNHEARAHMSKDLRRYAYSAVFAKLNKASPKGHRQFDLHGLAPKHANWESGHFADRFRVQTWNSPATTVTSHISKDGHYFIHPDPGQCRSLTVREAARLQTFPDNYFFRGNRTDQYRQVGNAVPPLLASLIARVVNELLQ